MKHLSLLLPASILFLTACNRTPDSKQYSSEGIAQTTQATAPKTKLFISGSYVARFQSPIAINTDTLTVAKIQNTATMFSINRKTVYQKILADIPQPVEEFTEQWIGSYDANTQTMYIVTTGQRFHYTAANGLHYNGTNYTKLE